MSPAFAFNAFKKGNKTRKAAETELKLEKKEEKRKERKHRRIKALTHNSTIDPAMTCPVIAGAPAQNTLYWGILSLAKSHVDLWTTAHRISDE
ncbi:hypothetical protein IHE26_16980 (plasmid) [Plesiomonas shigelloides]|uniref:hypothetical protein n=1 Tax=Plesiomonas shigelloides TaxID=703 RepID=UPI0017812152|nr:hypothetical protein [Plesiomonas shigelloides]QOH81566.1 hypothetical protein IHE26_16980 [Plesiomonas shigelloides]